MSESLSKRPQLGLEFNREQIDLVKNTVAKGATDNELSLFLHLSKTYGLDPFAKEIFMLKYGNQAATIITGRDGYLKIANNRPEMDGMQSDAVYSNDSLVKRHDGTVEHSYGSPERGTLIGAYAMVFRKDRSRPSYFYAPMSDYMAGSNPTWKKYPTAMIVKVAEACALKRAFSISGLVTQEEMDVQQETARVAEEAQATYAEVVVVEKPAAPAPTLNQSVYAMLHAKDGAEANAAYAAATAATKGHENFLEAVNLTKQRLKKPEVQPQDSPTPTASDESTASTEVGSIQDWQSEAIINLLNNAVVHRDEKNKYVANIPRMSEETATVLINKLTEAVALRETGLEAVI